VSEERILLHDNKKRFKCYQKWQRRKTVTVGDRVLFSYERLSQLTKEERDFVKKIDVATYE
jgi:hypothetical protein